MKILKSIILSATFCWLLSSCGTLKINSDFNYFQSGLDSLKNFQYSEPFIQNGDQLSIQLFSNTISQEQAAIFNLPSSSAVVGTESASKSGGLGGSSTGGGGFVVDLNGNIDYPIVGTIKCQGLTKIQLAKVIEKKVEPYVKEPTAVVKFSNFKINILGEVKKPGIVYMKTDKPTILDAIGEAGDLAETGDRKTILLIRETNGKRNVFKINFKDAALFNTETFQLQQNDLIYVSATTDKLKNLSTANLEQQRRVQTFQLGFQILTSIALLLNLYFQLRNK